MIKKTTALFALLALSISLFSQTQTDTLAGWTFPTGNDADTMAEYASSLNLNASIKVIGTDPLSFKNGNTTKAAQTTGWDNGSGAKFWQVTINTQGYENVQIYSKQTSGGSNPGPRDFAVFYSIGDTEMWSKLDGSDIQVMNDWTTGVINGLIFPSNCSDIETLHIKWVMTSDTASDGSLVASTGTSKIDDIFVTAEAKSSGIQDVEKTISFYPNPTNGALTLNNIQQLYIYNTNGQLVSNFKFDYAQNTVDLSTYERGTYILRGISFDQNIIIHKLMKY